MTGKTTDKSLQTFSHETSVPKYNLMSLDEDSIINEIEYLLFIDHEENMKSYRHLQPLIKEVAKLVVQISDRAVAEFQRDMTYRIAKRLEETIGGEIASVIYESQIGTTDEATVTTVIDDEKVVSTIVEAHRDW